MLSANATTGSGTKSKNTQNRRNEIAKFASLTWESPKQIIVHAIVDGKHFTMAVVTYDNPVPPFSLKCTQIKYETVDNFTEKERYCEGEVKEKGDITINLGNSVSLVGELEDSAKKGLDFKLEGLGAGWRAQGTDLYECTIRSLGAQVLRYHTVIDASLISN